MRKLAALAALSLVLAGCDASNPVAPAVPQMEGGASVGTGAAACATTVVPPGADFFTEATASLNNFTLRATVRLDAGGKEGLSTDSASDLAILTLAYERPAEAAGGPASAVVSTSLGFFVDQAGRQVTQCTVDLQSPAAAASSSNAQRAGLDANDAVGNVALRPGNEIGRAQMLAQLGELSVTPQGVPIIEAPPQLTADFVAEPNGLDVIFTDMSLGEPDRWAWDFGDGVCPKDGNRPVNPIGCVAPPANPECCQQNPVHEYQKAQEYVVSLRVKKTSNPEADSVTNKFVSVGSELELKADFEFDVGSGESLKVLFTDTSQGPADKTYAWDFDDGSCPDAPECAEQNPVHTFSVPGEYAVTLTVSAAGLSSSKRKLVNVGAGIPPLEANFTSTVAEGSLTVTFVNQSTGDPMFFAWTFGENPEPCPAAPECDDENPIHTYTFSGEYVVTLEVTDAAGNTDLTSKVIEVDSGEVRPVARFSFEIVSGLTVKFVDESDNNPTAWSWLFDDGSCDAVGPRAPECDEPNPTHEFLDGARQYRVELTASNGAGEDSTFTTVDLRALQADFSFRQDGCSGIFTDRSTGNIASWDWDFGDTDSPANSSAAPSPTHDYTCPDGSADPDCVAAPLSCDFGDYQVRLTIEDADGGSSTRTKSVTIAPF